MAKPKSARKSENEQFRIMVKHGGHEQAEFVLAVIHWLEHHKRVISSRQFFWQIEKSMEVFCWGRSHRTKTNLATMRKESGDYVTICGQTSDFSVKSHEELVELLESMSFSMAVKFGQDHAVLTLGNTTWVVITPSWKDHK